MALQVSTAELLGTFLEMLGYGVFRCLQFGLNKLNIAVKGFIWSSLHRLSLPFVQKDLEEVL